MYAVISRKGGGWALAVRSSVEFAVKAATEFNCKYVALPMQVSRTLFSWLASRLQVSFGPEAVQARC